ncbi:MAG TPA: N-glycosylase/DNA lyase [Candidatus Bathyarchaeota archaeon]|nr:N-glycosylase/DNA lyase [Candidatus Bathyarchaeota archaeon]
MAEEFLERLLSRVEELKRSSVKALVDSRLREFRELGLKGSDELFKELCFCILTANFDAEKSIRIQEEVDEGFLSLSEEELAETLRRLGHRYPRKRAEYIVEARKLKDSLNKIVGSLDGESAREWLVKNVRGIGYKEASHFLRNVGYTDLAIIDYHILDLLVKHRLIEKPRTMTRRRYLEIESLLKRLADRLNVNLAELDLYLWYLETGKILK